MPGATSRFGFPYPVAGDSPAGHTQVQALAMEIENQLGPMADQIIADMSAITALQAASVATNAAVAVNANGIASNVGLIADRTVTHAMTVVISGIGPGATTVPWTNTGSVTADVVAASVHSITSHGLVLIQASRSSPGSTAIATVWRNVGTTNTPAATAFVRWRSV